MKGAIQIKCIIIIIDGGTAPRGYVCPHVWNYVTYNVNTLVCSFFFFFCSFCISAYLLPALRQTKWLRRYHHTFLCRFCQQLYCYFVQNMQTAISVEE